MEPITVFYVEDEPFLGKIVKETLEGKGYKVVMHNEGGRAAEIFRTAGAAICLLDVMLPGKDGFQVAKEIRESHPAIPIIFLTAKTTTEDVVKGFKTGANDYIRKPFSMEELIVRIENALRNANGNGVEPANDEVLMGKYRFHLKRQILNNGSEEKKLSFREAELLKMLYNHRNQVIDRRDILKQLWGNDSFFNSRNLDVYITKLRNYLKDDPQIEIITIKGIGYRFVV